MRSWHFMPGRSSEVADTDLVVIEPIKDDEESEEDHFG